MTGSDNPDAAVDAMLYEEDVTNSPDTLCPDETGAADLGFATDGQTAAR